MEKQAKSPQGTGSSTKKTDPFVIYLLLKSDHGQLTTCVDKILHKRRSVGDVFLFSLQGSEAQAEKIRERLWASGSKLQTIHQANGAFSPIHSLLRQLHPDDLDRDIIIVEVTLEVPCAWDIRLHWAAYADAHIASVSPLCDSSPMFGLCSKDLNGRINKLDLQYLDRLSYRQGARRNYEVPVFSNRCVYFRKEPLIKFLRNGNNLQKSHATEFNSWLADYFQQMGYLNVVCDHIYVRSNNPPPAGEEKMDANLPHFSRGQFHPLNTLRKAVRPAIMNQAKQSSIPGVDDRPIRLHVAHRWGGGIEQWLKDFCASDRKSVHLILDSVPAQHALGQRFVLYRGFNDKKVLQIWDFSRPIRATAIISLEYRQMLQQIVSTYGIDSIIVSSFLGHSLDLLNTDHETIVICHDYYPFCPAINIHFKGVCETCESEKLKQCFETNKANKYFDGVSDIEWKSIRDHFIDRITGSEIRLIAPTNTVVRYLQKLDSRFLSAHFTVIPHGTTVTAKRNLAQNPKSSKRLSIVIPGRMAQHKGFYLLKASYKELLKFADLYFVGCGSEGKFFSGKRGIKTILNYSRKDLPDIIDKIRPDLGLLPSVWPETFSYTLSELWQFGIPPVAMNLGSFAERIEDGVTGFLVEAHAAALISRVENLAGNPSQIHSVKAHLAELKLRSADEMAKDYNRLAFNRNYGASRYLQNNRYYLEIKDHSHSNTMVRENGSRGVSNFLLNTNVFVLDKLEHSRRFRLWQRNLIIWTLKASRKILRWL